MNPLKKYNSGDTVPKFEAAIFLFSSCIFRAFVELLPVILVIVVAIVDKGDWDMNFFISTDFALTMIFINAVSMIEIEERGSSKIDNELVTFQKYICMFFVLVFTVIYVFAYKHLAIALTNELVMYLSATSLLWWFFLKCKYGYRKYFEVIDEGQPSESKLSLK